MSNSIIFLILLSALLSLTVAGFQYFYKNRSSARYLWVLVFLRAVGIFSVLLLLINPEFVTTRYYPEKPNLILAVDNSTSIRNSGRAEEVRELVAQLANDPELQDRFNLQSFSFGKELTKTKEFDFSEPQTNIQAALIGLNTLFRNSTAPTLLITDGNQTFGSDYRFGHRNYRNTILPVAVGDTAAYQDLSLHRVNVNRYAFLNNQFPVEIILNYSGDTSVEANLRILQGSTTVFTQKVSLSENKNSQVVRTHLPASTIGVSVYSAEITPLPDEKNVTNNLQNFAVEVIDERTSVLVVGSFFHPDLGALKRSIETNKQREVEIRNIRDLPAEIQDYELLVLFQPTSEFAPLIKTLKSQNRNYLLITGPETDWKFLNQAQPYFQKEITGQTEEYFPEFNPDYGSFQLDDIGYDGFPPLQGAFGDIKTAEELEVLLFQKVQGVSTSNPLLATLEEAGSKKAFLFGTDLWKWRAQIYSEEASFENFDNFIGKLVQYLASNARKDRLSLSYENVYYSNENILLTAQYFDQNYSFDPRGNLSLEFVNKETRKKSVVPMGLAGNKYQVELNQLKPGDYTFTVTADGENLAASGSFTVVDYNVEDQFAGANLSGLQQVADSYGGRLYFPDQYKEIKEALLSDNINTTVQKSRQNRVSLIDWYYLLGIMALSFSAEWFLRKYHGLI